MGNGMSGLKYGLRNDLKDNLTDWAALSPRADWSRVPGLAFLFISALFLNHVKVFSFCLILSNGAVVTVFKHNI